MGGPEGPRCRFYGAVARHDLLLANIVDMGESCPIEAGSALFWKLWRLKFEAGAELSPLFFSLSVNPLGRGTPYFSRSPHNTDVFRISCYVFYAYEASNHEAWLQAMPGDLVT